MRNGKKRKLRDVFRAFKARVYLNAEKVMPVITAFTVAVASAPAAMGASADAGELLDAIVGIVAKLVTGLAAVFGVFGVVHYASANSEGDGPAKQKAMMQIGAAIMLVIVSLVIGNVTWSDYIATT